MTVKNTWTRWRPATYSAAAIATLILAAGAKWKPTLGLH